MKKIIFPCVFLIAITFLTIQDANAITITATPRESPFGPNDWIKIDITINGYSGGPVTWVAHRPDGSTMSGNLYQITRAGTIVHEIVRDASDGYFGSWSIDYTYNGVKQTVRFKVNPIVLTVLTDKQLYYSSDVMKINITTSYYIPEARVAQYYHLNFFDKKGIPAKDVLQIDIRAFQPSMSYNFPLSQLSKYNPPGLYKLKIQYYNTFVDVPFLLGDINKLMEISARTDADMYHQGDDVNLNLLFTRVKKSDGVLIITDPSGNITKSQFHVESVHLSLVLKDITKKIGTYRYEVQYSGVTKSGLFNVITNPIKIPNINLQINLDKFDYRPGEIIHAKIHTSNLTSNSIAIWTVDVNGTMHRKFSLPVIKNDVVLPYKINKNDYADIWKMYINYSNVIRTATFYVSGSPLDDKEVLNLNQYIIPTFVSSFDKTIFNSPTGIAVDSNDNVYVVDSGNSVVKKFGSDGNLLLSWGSPGSAKGEFKHPNGIFVNYKYVFVADTGNARIQMFDRNGNFIYTWGSYGNERGMFHTPVALASDKSNDLFISDSERATIQVFDKNDIYKDEIRPFQTAIANFTGTTAIAFDSDGNFYTATVDNKILKYSNIIKFINFFGSAGIEEGRFNNPSAIAVDSKDNFYVADTGNHRIQKFDSYGNFILRWGSEGTNIGQFEEPVGLAIDSKDNIYVVDKKNNTVQKFSLYSGSANITTPSWVKNTAEWWSEGALDKKDFAVVIKYMINMGLIKVSNSETGSVKIPEWFKSNADLWSSDKIDDMTFAKSIEYLISNGILKS